MIHSITNLAAVITEKSSHTVVLLCRDGHCRIIFKTGGKLDACLPGNLDSAIDLLTSPPSPLSSGQVFIHRVPAEATTERQILEWLQAIPGISIALRKAVPRRGWRTKMTNNEQKFGRLWKQKTEKPIESILAENGSAIESTITKPATAEDIDFGNPELMKWVPGEPWDDYQEHSLVMARCPLCGDDGCIYGGNLWGTSPCCYGNDDNGEDLRLEHLIATLLLSGHTRNEIADELISLQIRPDFRRDYIDRIAMLLTGHWGMSVSKKYKAYIDSIAPQPQRDAHPKVWVLLETRRGGENLCMGVVTDAEQVRSWIADDYMNRFAADVVVDETHTCVKCKNPMRASEGNIMNDDQTTGMIYRSDKQYICFGCQPPRFEAPAR